MRNISSYNIGIDIGTNSVGYAVTEDNGGLVKFKGQNMWGVRLFDMGVSAKDTRNNRCARRRYDRRKSRIKLLQDMMSCDVLSVDDAFFIRMSQSFLQNDDRDFHDIHTFFNDNNFNEVDYYKKFPTIYHLRKHLIESDEKEDIRLVYLALHHIVKYRGNFLYEGQNNISAENSQISPAVKEFLYALNEIYELNDIDEMAENISAILSSAQPKKDKVNEIEKAFNQSKEDKNIFKQISNAMVGNKAKFKLIFNIDTDIDEGNDKVNFSLSVENADTKLDDMLDDDSLSVYESLQKVYSAYFLSEIFKGGDGYDVKCISDAMIYKYEKHKKDLKILRRLFNQHFKESYDFMFCGKKDSDNQYIKANTDEKKKANRNYTSYIAGNSYCSMEQLNASIKKIIETKADELSNNEDYKYCMSEIENKTLLPKVRSTDNSTFPYQIHLEELEKIIDNQGKYYKNLLDNKTKICSLVSFRIPYYVGPLNEKDNPNKSRQFAWMTRKVEGEKIYPWNFEDVVDDEASAEKFITGMTNNCTYLPEKDVIPKNSLLYSEFVVLNEIKQIKVEGYFDGHFSKQFLTFEEQKDLFETLFKKNKSISESGLKNWLVHEKKHKTDIKITGFQKDNKFASSLTSYIDFTNIFGKIDSSNIDMIENLILWVTLFPKDAKILQKKIKKEYPQISNDKIEKICKLNYSGWSRLSRELLDGISINDNFGNPQTIIDTMRTTSKNFMQIINDEKLGFKYLIEKEAKPKSLSKITSKVVDKLAGSPAIKRGIKQSAAVVEELVSIMGFEPTNIYIEFAREAKKDGEKKRTVSKKDKIDKLYEDFEKDPKYKKIVDELKPLDNESFKSKMIYLYFLQNGKCMYSGKPLVINTLSQTCEIDHIIPQWYIKDDSLDNLVLVLKRENQGKTGKLLIDSQIVNNQRGFWEELLKNKFISQKKFNNLTREQFNKNDHKGFINRQLVETRQIIKHVANLFGSVYPNTKIIQIKSELPSNLRRQYGLYKNREVNDFHHAHDAYLVSAIGRYVNISFPHLKDEFDYSKYVTDYVSKENKKKYKEFDKNKNGIIVASYKSKKTDKETGEVLWDGKYEVERLHKYLNYKDCYISKKVEEQTGEFYNQTVYSKNTPNLIPLKSNLPTHKYGGYSGRNIAYSVVVEYDGKKKREKKLVGIPIYVVKLEKTKPNAILDYLSVEFKNPKILKDKIMKYQKIAYQGHDYYIASSKKKKKEGKTIGFYSELHNAKQLILPRSCNEIIYKMNNKKLVKDIKDENLIELYKILCEKIQNHYSCFSGTLQKLENAKDAFESLNQNDKIDVLNQIINMLHANAALGKFASYKLGTLVNSEGRMNEESLTVDDLVFINTSVTGLFENRCYGKDL